MNVGAMGIRDTMTNSGSNSVLSDKAHPCSRTCQAGAAPMTCYYNFTVESYHTLSKACFDCPLNQTDCFRPHCIPGNGIKRSITTVNRMLPGTAVQVFSKMFHSVHGILANVDEIEMFQVSLAKYVYYHVVYIIDSPLRSTRIPTDVTVS